MNRDTDPRPAPSLKLRLACRRLRTGGLVAVPTEAVWGLSCDPFDRRAVDALLQLKQRDWRKGLIVVASELDMLAPFIEAPSGMALKRAKATWPGPATWVFPAAPTAPTWITGEHDSVAVRVTAHPLLRALCAQFGGALVSTSANRAGHAPARSVAELRLHLGPELTVLPGALGGMSRPTSIREAATGHILRR